MTKNKASTTIKNKAASAVSSKHPYRQYIFPLYLVFYILGIIYIVSSIFVISNDSEKTTSPDIVQSKLNSQTNRSTLDFINNTKSPDEATKNSLFANSEKTRLKDLNGRINPLNTKDDY